MKKNIYASVCIFVLLLSTLIFPLSLSADASEMSLLQGYEAFRNEDWVSALFFFRKAISSGSAPEETWYMLILTEMFAGEYQDAIIDCNLFISQFPSGVYYPLTLYQRGRALFCQGLYDQSVAQFTEFCHLYPDHEMYASALFWIAEAFFNEYNYSAAKVLYERIVIDFSRDAKASESQERLRTIGQAEREEKLLYLLKVTGEEYIAAKEDYERKLKQYQSQDSLGVYEQLEKRNAEIEQLQFSISELEMKNKTLLDQIAELEKKNQELQIAADEARKIATNLVSNAEKTSDLNDINEQYNSNQLVNSNSEHTENINSDLITDKKYPELEELKRKAAELQRILEESSVGGNK